MYPIITDTYFQRLSSMNGCFRLGDASYKYIGQLKISHVIKGPVKQEFRTLVQETLKLYGIELP